MKECCGTCKYHKFDGDSCGWVCSNEESDHFYSKHWTEYSDSCKEWQEEEKRKMRFPFMYSVPDKRRGGSLFRIYAISPRIFRVRFPEFDYIKEETCNTIEFDREHILFLMLAVDVVECRKFMKKLYLHMQYGEEYVQRRIESNPVFNGFLPEEEREVKK